jgi:glycosyltransferase involved in cell wall biosynthesis
MQGMDLQQLNRIAIIPAFNEESTIGSVVLKTKRHVNDVLVIDDGSTDDTVAIAEMAGAMVVRVPHNSGKANAILTGFRTISNKGYDAAIMIDSDMQHDPDEIPLLLAPIVEGSADLVVGSRFLDSTKGIPRYRKVGQTILNFTTAIGSKVSITDSQSGFRALSKKAIENMDFESTDYNIESDMITYFAVRGLSIKEVPIKVIYDVAHGHKKHPVSHGTGVLANVVALIGYRRPLVIFGIPGLMMFGTGLLLGLFSLSQNYLFGWGWLFQSMAATILVIIGTMLAISALTLNSLVVIMRSSRIRP